MIWSLLKRDTQTNPQESAVHGGGQVEAFIEHAPVAMMLLNERGEVVLKNAVCKALFRVDCKSDRVHASARHVFADILKEPQRHEFLTHFSSVLANETSVIPVFNVHVDVLAQEGAGEPETLHLSLRMSPYQRVGVAEDEQRSVIVYVHDITEQSNLEMRFAHSQKMQAVGQLAGGIAHDFNNLLTAMIGFCDLLLMRHPAGDPSFADIMQVKQNANRAANLVRQLLAFSRRQTLQPKTLDMTEVLAELSNLICRLIGENIELKMTHGRDIGMVKADQGQLEQVLINLAVNARDAMKTGGTLSMRTSNVRISNNGAAPSGYIAPSQDEPILAGEYVLVEVEDSGTGISVDKIQKMIMPGMNGPTMFTTLEKKHAERMAKVQVIFISGYAEDAFADTFGTEREFNFLPKPFTLKQLASKIKDILQKAA
jgi:two-component system cell cycle sensor histidine kinase/response regulator CckA